MDRHEANKAVANFDLKRFALAGWILFVAAVAMGLGAAILVDVNYEWVMGVPPGQRVFTKNYQVHALAITLAGLATFLCGFGVCYLVGIPVIHPKPGTDDEDERPKRTK